MATEKVGAIFEIIDDASPTLSSTKVQIIEIDQLLNNLDKTTQKTTRSNKNLTNQLTTFNTRAIATKASITALSFAMIKLGKDADNMVLNLRNADETLIENAKRVNELEKAFTSLLREGQKLFVTEMGKWILILNTAIGATQGLTEEQIRAKIASFNSRNALKEETKEIDELNKKRQEATETLQNWITEMERLIADNDSLTAGEKAMIEQSGALDDILKKLQESGLFTGDAMRKLVEILVSLKRQADDTTQSVKRLTDATGRQFFESGRGERVQIKSDFVQEGNKWVLGKKQGP